MKTEIILYHVPPRKHEQFLAGFWPGINIDHLIKSGGLNDSIWGLRDAGGVGYPVGRLRSDFFRSHFGSL